MSARESTPGATRPPSPAPQGDGSPGPAPHSATDAGAAPGAAPAAAVPRKPPTHIQLTWEGEHRFAFGRPGGPQTRVDADVQEAPSPVDTLVGALVSCVSVDVVDILAKRRTPVASLTVDAVGERANAVPARLTRVELRFRITGQGIERVHAERAIDLAINKYCSVRDSLDPDLPVEFTLDLEAE
ncbi:MAG TPA: OsmC family protein [Gemmatimonadaceae bacterium]|nr:OsmC family protein [Gemmatimonadaceae bacterium]